MVQQLMGVEMFTRTSGKAVAGVAVGGGGGGEVPGAGAPTLPHSPRDLAMLEAVAEGSKGKGESCQKHSGILPKLGGDNIYRTSSVDI